MNNLEYQHPADQKTFAFESGPLSEHSPARSPALTDGEPGTNTESGVGALLKNERQRKGLGFDQVFEMTKIQPHILQALENEDWPSLPSPIFVKGFVRSYAHAVGLDEREVVELYQKIAPIESTPPKPLGDPVGSRKVVSIVLVILILTTAMAYFLWKTVIPGKGTPEKIQAIRPVGSSLVDSEPDQDGFSGTQEPPLNEQKESITAETYESFEKVSRSEKDFIRETSPPALSSETVDVETSKNSSEDKAVPSSSAEPLLAYEPETSPEPEIRELTLKATIREKTWVRVFVDDQDPKEYIFTPGSHPVWRAKTGMELLIGNAGGIGLEFNGEPIENIGNPGQVVRLNLPEGYKRKKLQD
jgi:cytoskeleton protein RodZ